MPTGDDQGFDSSLMRAVPKQQRARESVMSVLAAASEILVDDPTELSMSEIARRSGVSKASIYRYFPDMAAIVHTLALPYAARAEDRLVSEMSRIDGPVLAVLVINSLLDDVIETCETDRLARALFLTSFNHPYLGEFYNETVRVLAVRAVDILLPFLNDDPVERHVRKACIGIHSARSVLDLSLGRSKEEAKAIADDFRTMMFLAAEVNIHRPVPVDADPHVAGLLDS